MAAGEDDMQMMIRALFGHDKSRAMVDLHTSIDQNKRESEVFHKIFSVCVTNVLSCITHTVLCSHIIALMLMCSRETQVQAHTDNTPACAKLLVC